MTTELSLEKLKSSASEFLLGINVRYLPELFGITDGKAVGTFVEHEFLKYLADRFTFVKGCSASGIDFPGLSVDLKVTSFRQPQSSCPFSSARQKVYGLGYHLMVFVYEKIDDNRKKAARLNFLHAIFVDQEHTADFQTTYGLLEILDRAGNPDDIDAFLEERNLPMDEIGRRQLAKEIFKNRPTQGYLTVSNALQWRLQYGRIVTIVENGGNRGVHNLLMGHE